MMAGKVIKGSMCLQALGQTNVGALEDKRGPDIGDGDEGELVPVNPEQDSHNMESLKVTDNNIGEPEGSNTRGSREKGIRTG